MNEGRRAGRQAGMSFIRALAISMSEALALPSLVVGFFFWNGLCVCISQAGGRNGNKNEDHIKRDIEQNGITLIPLLLGSRTSQFDDVTPACTR